MTLLCVLWTGFALTGGFVVSLDIVYPRLLESRDEDGVRALKVNDDLVLTLAPSTVFSDVFVVRTFRDGQPHESYHAAEGFQKDLYHDVAKRASVMVTERDDLRVEGILGPGLRIRPLPWLERSLDGQSAHEIYKVKEKGHYADVSSSSDIVTSRQDIPKKTVYPEIHFIVQYDHALAFGFNETAIIRYLAVMLNVVNMRFRDFTDPKVQIRVAGITINKDPTDEPYVLRMYELKGFMDTYWSIQDMRSSPLLHPLLQHADMIMLIAGLNLAQGYGIGTIVETVAFTYLGGACTNFRFAIVEDTPLTYDGVHLIVHQIAHQLGCQDDGLWPDPSIPNHPGTLNCSYTDGYVMSFVTNDSNHFKFSNCCKTQMRHFFTLPDRSCLLHRNSNYTITRSKSLPGDFVNASDFCKRVHAFRYPLAYLDGNYNRSSCKLQCIAPRAGFPPRTYTHYAVEGARCDNSDPKKVCLSGSCVDRSVWDKYVESSSRSKKKPRE
ncbi:venom metalloproteinase BumaMPs1-like [Ornithodoros turicata]|uniref:venom metalloproteinase BumaMPs1-like n=1 Tax=Ornithodoros turicata TaxID=34597 RepID=UPI003138E698